MDNTMLLIYPALLLVLTFYGAAVSGKGEFSREFISPEQTGMIQASAGIGILLHHLTQQVTGYGTVDRGPVTVFSHMGILFSSLFFFFSGYGLLVSVRAKPDYLNGFLKRRLPRVLVPFWTVNLLTILCETFVYRIPFNLQGRLRDLSGITLIRGNGWFFVEITLLYLAFYFFFRLVRNKDAALSLLCAFTAVLIVFSFYREHDVGENRHWFRGEWWYNSTVTFACGCLYARFKEKTDRFFRKFYPILFVIFALLAVFTLRQAVWAVRHYGYYQPMNTARGRRSAALTLAAQSAACVAFDIFVLLLNMKIRIGSRALRFMAGMRVTFLLAHGYFVSRVFADVRMGVFARYGIVSICSLLACAVLSPAVRALAGRSEALLRRGGSFRHTGDTLESRIAARTKKKRLRRLGILAAAGALAFAALQIGGRFLRAAEFSEECESLQSARVGDVVLWGRFETGGVLPVKERLEWIVIKKEQDRVCLLTKMGIAGDSYNRRHEEVSWEDSDLRSLLQTETFTGMFSRYEAECVMPVNGDMISLLTAQEAGEAFKTDAERELVITGAAQAAGTNVNLLSKANYWDLKGYHSSWWWLRGENGEKSVLAPIVTADGVISPAEKEVNRPGGAIRPVIWVEIHKKW